MKRFQRRYPQTWLDLNFEDVTRPIIKEVLKPWKASLDTSNSSEVEWGKKIQLRIVRNLHSLLKPCNSMQDARDALPEWLAEMTIQCTRVLRTREPGWTLAGSESGTWLWNQLLDDLAIVRMAEYLE